MIRTKRLYLYPCTKESVNKIKKRTNYPLGQHIKHYVNLVESDPSSLGWGAWFVIKKDDKKVIGDMGFIDKPDHEGVVEIGCNILPDAQSKGYATEATQVLIKWAFASNKVNRIIAICDLTNTPSFRVLEKVGMRRYLVRGSMVYWEITASDFIKR